MSAELATEVLNATNPTAAVFPPSILEGLAKSTASMDSLSRMKCVYFGGGPLSFEIGEQIRKKVKLVTMIGASEVGFIHSLLPEHDEDWQYFEWNPYFGVDMQSVGDSSYEMVFRRGADRDHNGAFHTFPDLNEFHTKDLFVPHPSRPNLWKYSGRLDDVIVLSNGEKFNPITMEKIIEGHPLVCRAAVIGQGRFQSALLVEPNWSKWSEQEPASALIDQIWPTVQQANQAGPAHGRIMKNKIGVASKGKPFKSTPKQTTQKRLVIQDYATEIDDIYARPDHEETKKVLPKEASFSSVKCYVQKIISNVLGLSGLSDQEDLYAAGLDSLQTMQLSKVLQSAIPVNCSEGANTITAQRIYSNPTIEQLSRLVHATIHGSLEQAVSRSEKIDGLVDKYTRDILRLTPRASRANDQHAVILTGSTGSLGNYLLSSLLKDARISKVYCLNRSDARDRQLKSFQEKGLAFDADAEAKVEFLRVSFGEQMFGLDEAKYEEMLQSVDTIIHNAWRVDFNITVDSFEDVHIRGVRRFVDFSLQSTHRAHIHFVSSVGTIRAWKTSDGPVVPEAPMEKCGAVLQQGYSESKHVAERICLEASRQAGVPTTVFRVGQIAGPTTKEGIWNTQEWLPTIVATSKAIGKVPNALGSMPVDWVPVVCSSAWLEGI